HCRIMKSMSKQDQLLRSEVESQTELNVTSRTGGPNLAEGPIRRRTRSSSRDRTRTEADIWSPEICPIEGIEHVRLKSQIESLGEPKLLAHREVPGLQA